MGNPFLRLSLKQAFIHSIDQSIMAMALFTPEEMKKNGSACNGGVGITSGDGGKSGESSKPTRVVKSPEQLRVLEEYYSVDANPSREAKVELGLRLGLNPRQVQLWFCDKRRRDKNKKNNNTPTTIITNKVPLPGGVVSAENGDKKKKMGGTGTGGADKPLVSPSHNAPSSSTSPSAGSSASSRLLVKLKVPRPAGQSVRPTTPDPMATQWQKMPPLVEHCDVLTAPKLSSAQKRKFTANSSHPPPKVSVGVPNDSQAIHPALKRARLENHDASRVGNKGGGLTDEAHQIFRELRKEAERRRDLEHCCDDGETNKKQAELRKAYPLGVVPSASTAIHGKGHSGIAYAYCAETGQCFIITRRSPVMCPPRPVITHQGDIFCTTDKKPDPVPEQAAAAQENQIRRIQRRQEIQRAIKQGLRNFLQKRSR